MNIPTHLTHKPIISVNNYEKYDAKFINDTDVKALTIGFATYNNKDISAKIWRYDINNTKWKRQSEEMPLHRALDLSILIIASFFKDEESDFPITNLAESFINKGNAKEIQQYYQKNKDKIKPRIQELSRMIELFKEKESKKL